MAAATDSTVLGDFDDAETTHHGVTSRFTRRDGRYFVRTEGPGAVACLPSVFRNQVKHYYWTFACRDALMQVSRRLSGKDEASALREKLTDAKLKIVNRRCQSLLQNEMIVMDMVYNPLKTRFLAQAEKIGCTTVGGLAMFVHQGAVQFELWTSKRAPLEIMRRAVLDELSGR